MRGSAARRLALALAGHVHSGGGLSERSVAVLATYAGVGLVDLEASTASPSATDAALPLPTCRRCGRALTHPRYVGDQIYGSKCAKWIGQHLARERYNARMGEQLTS